MTEGTMIADAVLELAASSPDPNVRNFAIRHRKLQQELEETGAWLAYYGKMRSEAPSVPNNTVRTPTVRERAARTRTATSMAKGKRGQVDAFVRRVNDILLAGGQPLALNPLHNLFFQHNPSEENIPVDTFRQRLNKKPALISFNRDTKKYWPADHQYPEQGESSLAA